MTIRLGPDPNRLNPHHHHANIWTVPNPPEAPKQQWQATWQAGDSEPGSGTVHNQSFVESLYGFIVFVAGLVIGVLSTFLAVKFIRPESLSAAWIFGYFATFFVSAYVGAMIVYVVRRIVLAVLVAVSIGYAAYYLWMA